MNKPPFNPSQPYQVADSKPAFNPSAPFQVAELNPTAEEASLGVINRARYALSPFESNRHQQLLNTYGQENVAQDQQGNDYIKQNGQFLPVNTKGLSVADAANVLGATPEIAGGAIGAGVGFGAGSIPGAIAGGAIGSGIRQGLDKIINPDAQVVGIKDRAIEAGLSGAINASVPAIGAAAKAVYPELKTLASSGIKSVGSLLKSKPATQVASEAIGEGIAQAPVREAVAGEAKTLSEIAKRQNLPANTYAQTAGGKAIQAEGVLQDTPLVGNDIAKYVDKQLGAVKGNLEKITGEFLNSESTQHEVGLNVKESATKIKEATKKIAQNLYDKVAQDGENALVTKRTFFNKYREDAAKLGLLEPKGANEYGRAAYNPDTGFTKEEFGKLQNIFFDGMEAIKNNPAPKVRFKAIDAMTKVINSEIESMKTVLPDGAVKVSNAGRQLINFKKTLEDLSQNTLNREVPRLGQTFKMAKKYWGKFSDDEEYLAKLMPTSMGEEKIVKKVMSSTYHINRLKEIVGEKQVQEIGISHVKDILQKLGKSGVASADTARQAIRGQKAQIVAALGEKNYQAIVDNLYYLNKLNRGLNVQRPRLYDLLSSPGGWKDIGVKILSTGKNIIDANPPGVKNVAKEAAGKSAIPFKNTLENTQKALAPYTPNGPFGAGISGVLGIEQKRNLNKK